MKAEYSPGAGVQSKTFLVRGMSCPSCELKIEKVLRKMPGVKDAKASLANSEVKVEYDPEQVKDAAIIEAIAKLGYEAGETEKGSATLQGTAKKWSINQILGIAIIIFALYWVTKSTVGFNFLPRVDQSMGYGMLFVIGLLTSLHCVAMCGGINLSQCIVRSRVTYRPGEHESKFAKLKPSFLYNLGRLTSYTLTGGVVGALGSVISFSGTAKGIVAIIGGVFMVLIGINMLDIFPWLKRFKIGIPKFLGNKIYNAREEAIAGGNAGEDLPKRRIGGPFYIGLLNGLMPCGPLQTMQLYALGTGSFLGGATAMFLFSLGTIPLMFSFGALSSFLSGKFTHRMLKVSAVLVIVLGITMLNRGLSLSGVSVAAAVPVVAKAGNVAEIRGNVQYVTTTLKSGQYQPFIVQKGIPVRWTIRAEAGDLNGCNNPVTIPKYNIQKRLVPGDNLIEFTPDSSGNITYTCWMGMISSNIRVVDDLSQISQKDVDQVNNNSSSGGIAGSAGCCAASAQTTRFYGGRVPTDDLQIARIVNGVQEVSITVNDQGYAPAAVVLQRGVKARLKFIPEKLNSCNYAVIFPEYQAQLDLSNGQTETPLIDVTQDFTFQCWMGMLHGYVKVIDDLNNINLPEIKKEIEAYRPAGGGGCCGG